MSTAVAIRIRSKLLLFSYSFLLSFVCYLYVTEMEIHLRGCCQRMKIVENLDGAHFLLQEVKLAIRVYYPEDVKRFDELLRQSQASKVEEIHQLIENVHSGNVANNQDLDGLDAFRNHFKSTVVICVLPQAGSNDQFANSGSFVNRVQQIMCTWDRSGKVSVIADSFSVESDAISHFQLPTM